MIDYFALLEQPRQPSLDDNGLTTAYHAKALLTHPDMRAPVGEAVSFPTTFATLNDAYQTLQDPKRRLHHLLTLHGHAPDAGGGAIPGELADLFPATMSVIQTADAVLEPARNATNALTRSLQKPALLQIESQLAAQLERLSKLYDQTIDELNARNSSWIANADGEVEALTQLYFQLTYLGRWISQLEQRRVDLSLC